MKLATMVCFLGFGILASCGTGDFFIGGRCEIDSDCNSWSQQAEGTVCRNELCICADPTKIVGCAPGEDPCRPACVPADCDGICTLRPPSEWSVPLLVWTGAEDFAPECPLLAPFKRYQGILDVEDSPAGCGCACEPALTGCEIPTDWVAGSDACVNNQAGGTTTSFAAPAGWMGTCTSANPIGGGIQSLSIPAPGVTVTTPCTPKPTVEPPPASTGSRVAVVCEPATTGWCGPKTDELCVVDHDVAAGWQACIMREGDRACPEGYPTRHMVYNGVEDTRACEPCTCGAPAGGSCTIFASAWQNATCSGTPVASVTVTSGGDQCIGIPPVMLLGSKSTTLIDVTPASCAPAGGAPIGGVNPVGPTTFCCAD